MIKVCDGYICLSIEKNKNNWRWVAVKANKYGVILSVFKEDGQSIKERLSSFCSWLIKDKNYWLIVNDEKMYRDFVSELEKNYHSIFPKVLLRKLKNQVWDLKKECSFQFHLTKNITIDELLFYYFQSGYNHKDQLVKESLNLLMLIKLLLFDSKRTAELKKLNYREIIMSSYSNYDETALIKLLVKNNVQLVIQLEDDNNFLLIKKNDKEICKIKNNSLREALLEAVYFLHKKRLIKKLE